MGWFRSFERSLVFCSPLYLEFSEIESGSRPVLRPRWTLLMTPCQNQRRPKRALRLLFTSDSVRNTSSHSKSPLPLPPDLTLTFSLRLSLLSLVFARRCCRSLSSSSSLSFLRWVRRRAESEQMARPPYVFWGVRCWVSLFYSANIQHSDPPTNDGVREEKLWRKFMSIRHNSVILWF